MRHSQSKNLPYYFDAVNKVSRWEPPAGTDVEKLKLYMAKYHSGAAPVQQHQDAGQETSGKIRAAHLLVKHEGSRRPMSWREVRRRNRALKKKEKKKKKNPPRNQQTTLPTDPC